MILRPMNAPIRTSPYALPATGRRTIELTPTKPVPCGMGTSPTTAPGRHRMCVRRPCLPEAIVIWSMIPQGAPTTWFSTIWPRRANREGSTWSPR
jgi:hypothetical protein